MKKCTFFLSPTPVWGPVGGQWTLRLVLKPVEENFSCTAKISDQSFWELKSYGNSHFRGDWIDPRTCC